MLLSTFSSTLLDHNSYPCQKLFFHCQLTGNTRSSWKTRWTWKSWLNCMYYSASCSFIFSPCSQWFYTTAKIPHILASLPTSRQQVVFILLLILSDLLQGCSNKSDTVIHNNIVTTCVVNLVTFLLYHDCTRPFRTALIVTFLLCHDCTVPDVLEQPCNKSW